MKVIFSDRAFAAIMAETAEKIQTETGGLFLGVFRDGIFYIIEAIDPGPKSIFEVAYFEYDQQYTQHLINKIANLYDSRLELIGLWHRHPGSFDIFSSTDDGTNAKYASMRSEGAISALVNIDPKFRLTVYHVDYPHSYKKTAYEVGDELIPEELLRLKSPESFLKIMDKALYPERSYSEDEAISENEGEFETEKYTVGISFESFLKFVLPQMEKTKFSAKTEDAPEGESDSVERIVNELFNDLTYITDELGISVAAAAADGGDVGERLAPAGGAARRAFERLVPPRARRRAPGLLRRKPGASPRPRFRSHGRQGLRARPLRAGRNART